MIRSLIPSLTIKTNVDEWKLAQVNGRTFHVRVRVLTLGDSDGKVHGMTVTPFAVVVDDSQGRHVLPLSEGDSETDVTEFLDALLGPCL